MNSLNSLFPSYPSVIYSILLVCAVIAAGLFANGKRKLASNVFFACGIVFIGFTLGKSIFVDNRLSRETPTIDASRAEFMLQVGTAVDRVTSTIPMKVSTGKQLETYTDAAKVLQKSADNEPESVSAWAKLVVVEHESGKKQYLKPLKHLMGITNERAARVGQALETLYSKNEISKSEALSLKQCFVKDLPGGWYLDTTLGHLYSQSGQKEALAELDSEQQTRSMLMIFKLLVLTIFAFLSLIIGVVTIIVQLLFVARNRNAAKEAADQILVQAPADYGVKTIIAVFIAWLSTQLLVGLGAQLLMKTINPVGGLTENAAMSAPNVVLAAFSMGVLYLVSNGPGMLFAYLLALKPHGIAFFEGLKLRLNVAGNGPMKLIFNGMMTWFVAVPLVIVSYWIAMQFGSQGSSNPIIGLVMQAAHSGNFLAIALFYLTLGVFAPICEETLFRGFLYSSLRRKMGVFPSMLISAALFAGLHLDVGGLLPLFTLGCLFALIFEKTKSIVPSMITHGLWNSGTFTLVLVLFGN